MRILCAFVAASVIVIQGVALGASGSSAPVPAAPPGASPMSKPTPEQEAAQRYNSGLKHQEKADALARQAAGETSDVKKRDKLEASAMKEYEKARKDFLVATERNPRMHQAHGALGYVYRRTGDHAAALKSYDQALGLAPDYTPAIEYRAEAYLGLDRIEEAKQGYIQLFPNDRARADELLAAMKSWVEKRKADPGKLTPDAVQEFAGWVEERTAIANQTPSVSELQNRKW